MKQLLVFCFTCSLFFPFHLSSPHPLPPTPASPLQIVGYNDNNNNRRFLHHPLVHSVANSDQTELSENTTDEMHKILNKVENLNHHHQHPIQQPELPGKAVIQDNERFVSANNQPGTYPRVAHLSDGSFLSGYTHFEGDTRQLLVARSTDNAQHFEPWGVVSSGNNATNDMDNMFLLEVTPPGTILAAFRNHDVGQNGPSWFRITVCRSPDWGRTWAFASQAVEKGPPLGVWEPFMRKGLNGEIQMTFSEEFAPDDQRTMLVKSTDQGKTWTPPKCVAGSEDRFRDGMTGIAGTKDNGRDALVLVFETTRYGPHFDVEAMISYDDGASWHGRHEVFRPPHGRSAGSPQIGSFGDGSLAVVFMSDLSVSSTNWPVNASVNIVFSGPPHDGKFHWTSPKEVSPPNSSWPGIVPLDGHTSLVLYDHGGPKGKTITWEKK